MSTRYWFNVGPASNTEPTLNQYLVDISCSLGGIPSLSRTEQQTINKQDAELSQILV